jgi:hypothetical protein
MADPNWADFTAVEDPASDTKWSSFEAVPDPKALATGVRESIEEPARLIGLLTNPGVVAGSQMGQRQGRQIRADELQRQAQRAAAMTGGGTVSPTGPGMPALPEEDVAGIKAALTQGPMGLMPEEAPPRPTGPFGETPPARFDLAAEAANGPGPLEMPTRGEFQAPEFKPPSMLDAIGQGVGESALGTGDFVLSPLGIATLGMGALA